MTVRNVWCGCTVSATQKLLQNDLQTFHAPDVLIRSLESGIYDEIHSPYETPILLLIKHALRYNLTQIAVNAVNGKYNAKEEEWSQHFRHTTIFHLKEE